MFFSNPLLQRTRLWLVALIALTITPSTGISETVLPGLPPGVDPLAGNPAGGSRLEDLKATTFPFFVFVHGILGSRIEITESNGTQRTIWGRSGLKDLLFEQNLAYDEAQKTTATRLDDFSVASFPVEVYGPAFERLRSLLVRGKPNIDSFAYDWRQSNAVSARQLNAWLCQRSAELKNQPLIIVAHSMGGLVVKSWLMQFYKNGQKKHICGNQQQADASDINIERVFFLGTPHFGSPKAIRVFAEGYNLKDDDDDGGSLFGAVFGILDRNVFAPLLTKYGPTFPSAYELLPIYWKTNCQVEGGFFRQADAIDAPLIVDLGQGTRRDTYDIHSAAVWQDWGWPKVIPPNITAERYYGEVLPKMLANAKKFLCDIARYKMPEEIMVSNIVGRRVKGGSSWTLPWSKPAEANRDVTDLSYLLRKRPGKRATIETLKRGLGDGTVPEVIAANRRWSKTDFNRFGDSQHSQLLSDKQFIEYIDEIVSNAQVDHLGAALSDQQIGPMVFETYRRHDALAPLPRDPSRWNAPQYAKLAELNTQTLKARGVTSTDYLKTAQKSPSPRERATAAAIAATIEGATPTVQAEALRIAAAAELSSTNYALARDAAARAREMSDQIQSADARSKALAESATIEALAYKGLGDPGEAKKMLELAVREGFTVRLTSEKGTKVKDFDNFLKKPWQSSWPPSVMVGVGKDVVLVPKPIPGDHHWVAKEFKDRDTGRGG